MPMPARQTSFFVAQLLRSCESAELHDGMCMFRGFELRGGAGSQECPELKACP